MQPRARLKPRIPKEERWLHLVHSPPEDDTTPDNVAPLRGDHFITTEFGLPAPHSVWCTILGVRVPNFEVARPYGEFQVTKALKGREADMCKQTHGFILGIGLRAQRLTEAKHEAFTVASIVIDALDIGYGALLFQHVYDNETDKITTVRDRPSV